MELQKVLFGTENYMTIRSVHFVNIRFIVNNPRFNKWFKSQKDLKAKEKAKLNKLKQVK